MKKIRLYLILTFICFLCAVPISFAVLPSGRTLIDPTHVSTARYSDPGNPTPPPIGEWAMFFGAMRQSSINASIDIIDSTHSDIYKAAGYGFSDVGIIKTEDGLVLIDTCDGIECANKILDAMDENPDFDGQLIKYVIFTHMHTDHTRGASRLAVYKPENSRVASDVQIIASDKYDTSLDLQRDQAFLGKFELRARAWQSGRIADYYGWIDNPDPNNFALDYAFPLPWNAQELPVETYDDSEVPYADITVGEKYTAANPLDYTIGGKHFQFIHAPGETADHLAVYMPDEKILFCGDLWYWSFPNLQSPTLSHRNIQDWIDSLTMLIDLDVDTLVTQHGESVYGDDIAVVLTDARDAIQSVYSQAVAAINNGIPELEAAEYIANKAENDFSNYDLGTRLNPKPYLADYYGTVYWTVRGIYKQYAGVADGYGTELFRLPPKYVARDIVIAAAGAKGTQEDGANNILNRAILLQGQNEHQRCIELCDILIAANPNDTKARHVKSYSLWYLAYCKLNVNNWGAYRSAYTLEQAILNGVKIPDFILP